MYSNKSLTEKEIFMDLMSSEKLLTNSYNNAVIDSCCPVLRNVFSQCLQSAQNIQYSLFEAVNKRGWNQTQLVSDRDIKNMMKKYSNFY